MSPVKAARSPKARINPAGATEGARKDGARKDGARPIKRSFRIAGHQTSISLEGAFWEALKEAADVRRVPLARLVAEIDATRGETNLSSAVRVWLFADLQSRIMRAPITA